MGVNIQYCHFTEDEELSFPSFTFRTEKGCLELMAQTWDCASTIEEWWPIETLPYRVPGEGIDKYHLYWKPVYAAEGRLVGILLFNSHKD